MNQLKRLQEIGTILWNRQQPTTELSDLWSLESLDFTQRTTMLFALNWVDGGLVKLTGSHTFLAALAATESSLEAWGTEEVHFPAKAFAILVPEGVVTFGERSVTAILFATLKLSEKPDQPIFYLSLRDDQNRGIQDFDAGRTLRDFFNDSYDALPVGGARPWDDPENCKKAFVVCRRILLGILFSLQFTTNFREKATRAWNGHEARTLPPPHRVFFVGKPVSVDCRGTVREWLTKGGDPRGPQVSQSVQTLVRGHYKRQVVGVGRSGRKVLWIEPYWRGPEDAPIISRPLIVS